jgi:hypothetical protein
MTVALTKKNLKFETLMNQQPLKTMTAQTRFAVTTSIYLLLLVSLFSQCAPNKPDVEKILSTLRDRFPQLPKGNARLTDFYKLVRTVSIGDKNVQIQLWSTPQPDTGSAEKVLMFFNSEGRHYAMPLFSNLYRDYWDFQFDAPVPGVPKTNSTFVKELKTAMDTLHFNDHEGTGRLVLTELMFSVLQCQNVNEFDSLALLSNGTSICYPGLRNVS